MNKIINVVRPFTLHFKGVATQFAAGIHTVEHDIADHWFVKAHSQLIESKPEPEPEKEEETAPVEAKKTAKKK